MKKLVFAAFFVLSAFGIQTVSAQNYQPFVPNHTYHFTASDSVYTLKIASVEMLNGDSAFVFNQVVKPNNGATYIPPAGCTLNWPPHYIAYANNQFGQKMLKKTNGDYAFVTLQGQQYLLKTKATTGQSWTFNTNLNVTATLTSKTIEPVLTITDSVLTYTLSNGAEIKLSKNHGFLKAPNFAAYADPFYHSRELTFMGLPEKLLGKNYSHPATYFDYQPGDILLHYFTDQGSGIPCVDRWTKTEILSRSSSPVGTVTYQVNEQILEYSNGCPGINPGYNLKPVTTKTWTIDANQISGLGALTNSYKIFPNAPGLTPFGRASEGMFFDSTYNNLVRHNISNWMSSYCADILYSPEGYRDVSYVEGLGMVRNSYMEFQYRSIEVLQGYRKNGVTYGNLRTFAQIMGVSDDKKISSSISIFPNPAENIATLQFDQPLTSGRVSVSVLNALGQVVLQQQFSEIPDQQLHLSLEKLTKGLYVVQVKQNDKIYISRLVKQ